jgi:hypothetical protein
MAYNHSSNLLLSWIVESKALTHYFNEGDAFDVQIRSAIFDPSKKTWVFVERSSHTPATHDLYVLVRHFNKRPIFPPIHGEDQPMGDIILYAKPI